MSDKGHVYPRGKTYTYVIDLPPDPRTGKRRQKSKGGFKTEAAAWAAVQKVAEDIEKGVYTPEININVGQLFEHYIGYANDRVERKKMRITTLETYQYIINARILPHISNIRLKKLVAEDIEGIFKDMEDSEYSPSYIHGVYRVIRIVMRLAHYKWDYIPFDIMKKVEAPPNPKVEKRTWTLEQCHDFLEAAKKSPYYDIYFHIIYTGKRRGEVLGFPEDKFDQLNKIIEVSQTLTYSSKSKKFIINEPKTEKSKRKLPINDELAEKIKKRIHRNKVNKLKTENSQHDKWGLLYCNEDGSPIMPSKLRYDYEKIIETNNLPYISTHELRHSFATNLWELGYDLKDISELLGHSSIAITGDIYTHMREDKKQSVMDGFNKAMKSAKAVDN